MRKIALTLIVSLLLLVSCETTSYFAGSLGDVYLTSYDYNIENANPEVNNSYNDLKSALWGFKSSQKAPDTKGNKVLFYYDLKDSGFYNELVPENYRASSLDEAGFVIVATEGSPVFYSNYGGGSSICKVYYATGVLKLYSVKNGKLLYTGTTVNGPTPPSTISVSVGATSATWKKPEPEAFKSQIARLCIKISTGKISGSVPDLTAMEAAGVSVKSEISTAKDVLNIQGIWSATSGDSTIKLTFADNGLFIYEEWNNDSYSNGYIGEYTFDSNELTIDGENQNYIYQNRKLSLDLCSSEFIFSQKSKNTINKATASAVCGVWDGGNAYSHYTVGFTKNEFSIYQGSGQDLGPYSADNESINGNKYYIINDALYFQDEGFFGEYELLRFERKTRNGIDTTSQSKIVNSGDLTYTNVNNEQSGNIFRFYSSGKFTDIPFDALQTYNQKTGTYTYSDHIIELSDGRTLSIAIIDDYYLGSSR